MELTTEYFESWLNEYGRAWETGDAGAVLNLFTPDASYEETPFDPPMVGHRAIHAYWTEGAGLGQKEIRFRFEIVAIAREAGFAWWGAEFVRVPSGNAVKLDGILAAHFDESGLCKRFREWWHRQETSA